MRTNGEKSTTKLMERFMDNKVWAKLYGPLASEWLSIREASMVIDPQQGKEYTLNRSVQLCIKALEGGGVLETQRITKTKESKSKKGAPRKYTSTCPRHKLNVIKLWFDFFTENCPLSDQEKDFLHSILCVPGVEHILRNRKMGPRGVLTILVSQFAFMANARPETEDFLKRVGTIATKNLTVSNFLEPKDRDEFVNALREKILENRPLAVRLSQKIINTNLEIFFTSQDFSTLIMRRIPEDQAHVFAQILLKISNDPLLKRYGRFIKKRVVDIILSVYRGEVGPTFTQNIEHVAESSPNSAE